MEDWYSANWSGSIAPWSISTTNPAADCPNSEAVYSTLTGGAATTITNNVQGMATLAASYSPGTRVAVVGYPYIVDVGNDCAADSGTWHGFTSTTGELNSTLTSVTGTNVRYVDLMASGNLGTSPVTDNYLQLTRLYGYPHESAAGQSKTAGAVVGVVRGSGW
jgi:hypothetical protein